MRQSVRVGVSRQRDKFDYRSECTLQKDMLADKFSRAAVFFVVAFSVPVLLSVLTGGEFDRGVQIGVVMGVIFAVVSQYFEPISE